jgi:D-sedoheptulose 7-phosphate isomerase
MLGQMEEKIRHLFGVSIEIKMGAFEQLSPNIAKAGKRLVDCLLNDGKILLAGNGGSAANCYHFSANLLNRFDVERPPLPVINIVGESPLLTGLANEHHYQHALARSVQALGQEGDVLIALTTTGNSDAILNALHAAHERGMDTIALSGRDGGVLACHLGPEDIELRVQAENTARIREIHLFILHCFCDLIDNALFAQMVE